MGTKPGGRAGRSAPTPDDASSAFWERPEIVEEFAGREPDGRLQEIIGTYPRPGDVHVLDIGCAGGRNTELLARHGFDVYAIDTSVAMVMRTRARVAAWLGAAEAEGRVRVGSMQELDAFAAGWFDLLVALGVYHNASGDADWKRTVAASVRVLKPGGRLLWSTFTPRSAPEGIPVRRLRPDEHLYDGFESGALYLRSAAEVERGLAAHGLYPVTPTVEVTSATEIGFRVSVNGLYEKR